MEGLTWSDVRLPCTDMHSTVVLYMFPGPQAMGRDRLTLFQADSADGRKVDCDRFSQVAVTAPMLFAPIII